MFLTGSVSRRLVLLSICIAVLLFASLTSAQQNGLIPLTAVGPATGEKPHRPGQAAEAPASRVGIMQDAYFLLASTLRPLGHEIPDGLPLGVPRIARPSRLQRDSIRETQRQV